MATRPKFAKMANYLCEWVKASHIFLKNGLWRMSASLASPPTWLGECRRVWRVLAKVLGECRRVWRVLAKVLGKCWRVWRVLAKSWPMIRQVVLGTNYIFYMYKMIQPTLTKFAGEQPLLNKNSNFTPQFIFFSSSIPPRFFKTALN